MLKIPWADRNLPQETKPVIYFIATVFIWLVQWRFGLLVMCSEKVMPLNVNRRLLYTIWKLSLLYTFMVKMLSAAYQPIPENSLCLAPVVMDCII